MQSKSPGVEPLDTRKFLARFFSHRGISFPHVPMMDINAHLTDTLGGWKLQIET